MIDNINIDKMLEKQSKRLHEINNEEPERIIYNDTCYHDVKKAVSFTRMASHKGDVLLFRYIGNKVIKVLFNNDVKVAEILPYLDLSDDAFIACSARAPIVE